MHSSTIFKVNPSLKPCGSQIFIHMRFKLQHVFQNTILTQRFSYGKRCNDIFLVLLQLRLFPSFTLNLVLPFRAIYGIDNFCETTLLDTKDDSRNTCVFTSLSTFTRQATHSFMLLSTQFNFSLCTNFLPAILSHIFFILFYFIS